MPIVEKNHPKQQAHSRCPLWASSRDILGIPFNSAIGNTRVSRTYYPKKNKNRQYQSGSSRQYHVIDLNFNKRKLQQYYINTIANYHKWTLCHESTVPLALISFESTLATRAPAVGRDPRFPFPLLFFFLIDDTVLANCSSLFLPSVG